MVKDIYFTVVGFYIDGDKAKKYFVVLDEQITRELETTKIYSICSLKNI